MTAHGTDPDLIDEERFTDICIMYADGMIGNRGTIEVLGALTAGIYNYMRADGQRAFKLEDIIPRGYEYIYPPLTEQEKKVKVNESLLTFMQSAPNAPKMILKGE